MVSSELCPRKNPSKIVRSVEPDLRFRVKRVRGAPPTCMWIVKAPLRRGFP
jgi:hypothetical protein